MVNHIPLQSILQQTAHLIANQVEKNLDIKFTYNNGYYCCFSNSELIKIQTYTFDFLKEVLKNYQDYLQQIKRTKLYHRFCSQIAGIKQPSAVFNILTKDWTEFTGLSQLYFDSSTIIPLQALLSERPSNLSPLAILYIPYLPSLQKVTEIVNQALTVSEIQ